MPSGLAALLDDVAAIARLAATSVDDIATASSRAGSSAVGVVIDDAAVTPQYTNGLSPSRELPIIWRIAKGSIFNKLVILLPAAVLLSWLAPILITPILMLGGTYLCFEGAEKVMEMMGLHHAHTEAETDETATNPQALEDSKAKGAIRTDLILSAEIMAIALADVTDRPILTQIATLAIVGIGITALVYGVVGFIVKMDDIGLHLAKGDSPFLQRFGRSLVKAMPVVLSSLELIGMLAMLWVGGGIVVHGLEVFDLEEVPHAIHTLSHTIGALAPIGQDFLAWLVGAIVSGVFGLMLGAIVATVITASGKLRNRG